MLSTAMFVYKNLCLEAVPPHLVYIIKFFVANQIVYSHSIPVHISDISLAENRKVTQKIWETGLNCLSLRISRKCDSHEVIELDHVHAAPKASFILPLSVPEKLKAANDVLSSNTSLTQATFPVEFNIHHKTNTAITTASYP